MIALRVTSAVGLIVLGMVWAGCAPLTTKTMGERESGYTYVPIDPFAVRTRPADSCSCPPDEPLHSPGSCDDQYRPLLESLPDNAVRMLVEQFNASGSVTYGAAKVGTAGESFQVTVDYINADTIDLPVFIRKWVRRYEYEPYIPPRWLRWSDRERKPPVLPEPFPVPVTDLPTALDVPDSETYSVQRLPPHDDKRGSIEAIEAAEREEQLLKQGFQKFDLPLYVGIGLRISTTVEIIGASANIAGIGVIAAEAEANNLRGSLVVQTLGVNGKSIAAALPIQSELNRTTAQNAIVAVGAIKALLYAQDTVVSPRVVGLYLPFPGGKALVNAIVSAISNGRVDWKRPCVQKDAKNNKPVPSTQPTDTSLSK